MDFPLPPIERRSTAELIRECEATRESFRAARVASAHARAETMERVVVLIQTLSLVPRRGSHDWTR